MTAPTKTLLVARWPNGTQSRVRRKGRMWVYIVPGRLVGEHGSSDLVGVRDVVEAHGGKLDRIPNDTYEAELRAYRDRQLRRMFKPFW